MTVCLIGSAIFLGGCRSVRQSKIGNNEIADSGAIALRNTSKNMDLHNIENIYSKNCIRAFQVGRYVDDQDESLMHESHTVYQLIDDGRWNLNSNLPAAVPMGDSVVVALPENRPNFSNNEIMAEQNNINEALGRILDENLSLKQEVKQLKRSMELLSAAQKSEVKNDD